MVPFYSFSGRASFPRNPLRDLYDKSLDIFNVVYTNSKDDNEQDINQEETISFTTTMKHCSSAAAPAPPTAAPLNSSTSSVPAKSSVEQNNSIGDTSQDSPLRYIPTTENQVTAPGTTSVAAENHDGVPVGFQLRDNPIAANDQSLRDSSTSVCPAVALSELQQLRADTAKAFKHQAGAIQPLLAKQLKCTQLVQLDPPASKSPRIDTAKQLKCTKLVLLDPPSSKSPRIGTASPAPSSLFRTYSGQLAGHYGSSSVPRSGAAGHYSCTTAKGSTTPTTQQYHVHPEMLRQQFVHPKIFALQLHALASWNF